MFLWLLLASQVTIAQTRPLNDTGITWSGHATSGNAATCDPAHPAGQDCHYGRDAQVAAGTLTKAGGGSAGFDFTALDANGNPTTPSSGTNPHPCVRDNVTGLIWEVKTDDGGLHDKDWTYTWYNTNSPDGNPGTASGGTCYQVGRCDTEKFVADVNAVGWCGYTDWRMPKVKELEGIADLSRVGPSIDPNWFPNTSPHTWSGSPSAICGSCAWGVSFYRGSASGNDLRHAPNHARLVRGGM
jgi:hypothetical protein